MLLPLKAVILSKPLKDGTYTIYYQYCYSSEKRVLLNTELSVLKQYWNRKKQCFSKNLPIEIGDEQKLNVSLNQQKKVVEALIEQALKLDVLNPGLYVKERFTPHLTLEVISSNAVKEIPKKESDFFEQIELFIKAKAKQVNPLTMGAIHGMRDHLKSFQEHTNQTIKFSSLDFSFYSEFVEFLTYDYQLRRTKEPKYGLKTSTIGRTIKKLRMFVKDRSRRKIIQPIDLSDFLILDEEADTIYLSYEEIELIYKVDLSDYPHLVQYRDLFVLGCLTALRFSDFTTLQFSDAKNGLLYKKAQKVDTWTVVPLMDEAQEIFDRYFKNGIPRISNPKFNKYIKDIGKLAGIVELVTVSYKKGNRDVIETKPKYLYITTHTARRSFCTNEFLAGTDVALIMQISGHKSIKDFYKYIRIAVEVHAANQMKEIWKGRNGMKVFNDQAKNASKPKATKKYVVQIENNLQTNTA